MHHPSIRRLALGSESTCFCCLAAAVLPRECIQLQQLAIDRARGRAPNFEFTSSICACQPTWHGLGIPEIAEISAPWQINKIPPVVYCILCLPCVPGRSWRGSRSVLLGSFSRVRWVNFLELGHHRILACMLRNEYANVHKVVPDHANDETENTL